MFRIYGAKKSSQYQQAHSEECYNEPLINLSRYIN